MTFLEEVRLAEFILSGCELQGFLLLLPHSPLLELYGGLHLVFVELVERDHWRRLILLLEPDRAWPSAALLSPGGRDGERLGGRVLLLGGVERGMMLDDLIVRLGVLLGVHSHFFHCLLVGRGH